MVAKIRAQRIAEQIRTDLSEMFLGTITDPRLEGVTITNVTVDRELAYAKIYVSALEGSERKDEILEGLRSASGFLRHRLTKQIELRSFPQLRFKWDPTAEKTQRIDELFESLHASEESDSEQSEGTSEEEIRNDG